MRRLLLVLFVFFGDPLSAQEITKAEIIQTRIEFLSEQLEMEEVDLTDVLAQLNFYFDNPLNLNEATADQLRELALLTDIQINELILHRELNGKFISIYELQSLRYLDLITIRMVLPFVRVDEKLDQLHLDLREILKYATFEGYLRYQRVLEEKDGYKDVPDSVLNSSNAYYHGNADKYYARFRYSYRNNLSFGLTADKDPGEEFFRGSQREGFDFYSAHAFFKGGKYLRAIALGDYQIQVGQGLNLWSGYAFRKTADVTNVKRTATPLKPYTSVDENRFLRGAAVDVGYKKLSLLLFASVKNLDGTESSDSTASDDEYVTSINLSGLHRTNSEIGRKNTLREYLTGANLRYQSRALQIGLTGIYQAYDKALIRDTQPYNLFAMRGRESANLSLDYAYVYKNLNVFGEASYAGFSGSFAFLQGALIALDRRVSMAFIYRNYAREYASFYTAGFGETSATNNEQGLYSGVRLALTKSLEVQSYADLFSFPWLRYQVDAPSRGHELLVQTTYRPSKVLEIYLRYREQSKADNSIHSDGSVRAIETVIQRNYRLNIRYKIGDQFILKSRAELVTRDRKDGNRKDGFIITQDFVWSPKNLPVDLTLRYALFDTDDYDTRIYSYENNALYVFSIPAYYYRGSRAYVLIRYQFFHRFDLWVRLGRTIYNDRDEVGSGAELTKGNTRTDLTIQLRIKL